MWWFRVDGSVYGKEASVTRAADTPGILPLLAVLQIVDVALSTRLQNYLDNYLNDLLSASGTDAPPAPDILDLHWS